MESRRIPSKLHLVQNNPKGSLNTPLNVVKQILKNLKSILEKVSKIPWNPAGSLQNPSSEAKARARTRSKACRIAKDPQRKAENGQGHGGDETIHSSIDSILGQVGNKQTNKEQNKQTKPHLITKHATKLIKECNKGSHEIKCNQSNRSPLNKPITTRVINNKMNSTNYPANGR